MVFQIILVTLSLLSLSLSSPLIIIGRLRNHALVFIHETIITFILINKMVVSAQIILGRLDDHAPVFIYGVEGEQIEEENDAYNDLRYKYVLQ